MNEPKPYAMIIEDNRDLALIFGEAFQAAGLDTDVVRDAQTALDHLGVLTPSIIVLDLHLPRVSGEEFLKQIRADARLAGTKVIIATADPLKADRLRDRADMVLLKPISFGQLRDLAARLSS